MSWKHGTNLLGRWAGRACRAATDLLGPPRELARAKPRGLNRLVPLEDRRLLSATPVGAEFRVNTTTAGSQVANSQTPQSVARSPAGGFVVVWSSKDQDGNGWGVYAQRFSANGTAQGGEFRVNQTTGGDQQNAVVSMDANGNFVVAWQSNQGNTGLDVYARLYRADGTAVGGEFVVNTYLTSNQQSPSVAMDASGSFVVAWQSNDQDGNNWGVFGQRFDAAGNRVGGEFQINTYTANNQQDVRIAMAPDGRFVAAWASNNQDGNNWGVYGQQFGAAGNRVGGEFLVNATTANTQQNPAVAMDAAGNYVVAWEGNQAGSWDVYAQRFGAAGNRLGGEFVVNTTTANAQQSPSAAFDGLGGLTITWSSKRQDNGDTFGIYAQSYTPAGTPTGREFLVNTITANDQKYSSVAADRSGGFVVAWGGNGSGDGDGVFARTYVSAGFAVTPTTGLVTSEAGASARFTVALLTAPTADVTLSVASSDPGEGTPSVTSLTFTPLNWNVAQTVVVTGVDDFAADGDLAYAVTLGPAVSADPLYNGLTAPSVRLVNTDNDTPGFTVSPVAGLTTTEAGGSATFTVVLNTAPLLPVTISVASGDPAEGTVSVSSLTFTLLDWNVPQTVTVTGVDDAVADGDRAYTILLGPATGLDLTYAGLKPPDVSVTNLDDDVAGIQVAPVGSPTTTEFGGTASFAVVLTSRPTADVTITLASDNPAEGVPSVTSLTFTRTSWNVAQTVTVTGVDDAVADGAVAYSIVLDPAASADPGYDGLSGPAVALTNLDNEAVGVRITPLTPLVTTEAGGTASFAVVLLSQPTDDVTFAVDSSDPGEGGVSVSSLTFTATNWNVAQTVTVTGVDDFVADGDRPYTIRLGPAVSADSAYQGLDPADVALTNRNDDVAGIRVTPLTPPNTNENGLTATFAVVLTSQPTADVTVSITSTNPGEGTPSVASLTFTAADWNVAQSVVVTGVDDPILDGDRTYSVVVGPAASADLGYDGYAAAGLNLTNFDNDGVGISVHVAGAAKTTEGGGQCVIELTLTSRPTADVTFGVRSTNPAEGVPDVTSVTFTPLDWDKVHLIKVRGVDDFVADGDQAYTLILGPAASADLHYDRLDPADIALVNRDDDVAGLSVAAADPLVVGPGSTVQFKVVLDSQPTANVSLALTRSASNGDTLSTVALMFTPADWNTAQVVTITGGTTAAAGPTRYTITGGGAVSADPLYQGQHFTVTVVDSAGTATNPPPGPGAPPPVPGAPPPGPGPSVPPPGSQPPPAVPSISPALPSLLVGSPSQTAGPAMSMPGLIVLLPAGNLNVPPSPATEPTGGIGSTAAGAAAVGGRLGLAASASASGAAVSPLAAAVQAVNAEELRRAGALFLSPASAYHRYRQVGPAGSAFIPAPAGLLDFPPPSAAQAAVEAAGRAVAASPMLSALRLWEALDDAGDGLPPGDATAEVGLAASLGVLATSGYVLLNTRTGLWLLSLLTARPLWKQFDPLEVLYAWEAGGADAADGDDETLVSLVE